MITVTSKKYTPEPGRIVVVPAIPNCNFCLEDGVEVPGPYDFKTSFGPWANGCKRHWNMYKAGPLGVGSGQLWITADQTEGSVSPPEDEGGEAGW